MGALAVALRKKFKTPREALLALGLDPSLLDVKQLAKDGALKRGRDGNVLADLVDQPGGHQHWNHGPKADGDPDLGDEAEEQDDDREMPRWLMHDHETEAPPDEELAARRRWWMRKAGDYMLSHGKDEAAVRDALESFPKNGLEHMALDDDVDTVMSRLTGMGGGGLTSYEPKAKDRKRMAKDRALAQDSFDRMFPDAQRLTGSDMSHRYGDQLAMDAAVDGDGSFDAMFPQARRIGIA